MATMVHATQRVPRNGGKISNGLVCLCVCTCAYAIALCRDAANTLSLQNPKGIYEKKNAHSLCACALVRSPHSLTLRHARYTSRVSRSALQGATSTTASTSTGVASKTEANLEKATHVRAHQKRSRTASREKKRKAFRADTHTHAQNTHTQRHICACAKTALQPSSAIPL